MKTRVFLRAFTLTIGLLLVFPIHFAYAEVGEEQVEELDEKYDEEIKEVEENSENISSNRKQTSHVEEEVNEEELDTNGAVDVGNKDIKVEQKKADRKYEVGNEGDHVVALKKDLVRLGFASWSNPSPNYGSITAGVVGVFQDYYNLPVTGVADEATRNKIAKVLEPPYQSGDRGEPVVELKEKLVKLGFASWKNPSLNYGSITAGVLKDFQKAYGLTADGIAGDATLTKLDTILTDEKFHIGDSGVHVVALKKDLVRLGFASWLNPSENYGPITAGVVETFQKHYGLRVSGIANKITLNKIAEVLNPPYKSGDQGEPITELKEKLVKLGYASWEKPSHNYGAITAGIVREFQRAYGLAADGVADDGILTKIDKLLAEGKYKIDDQGDHVVALKKDLVRLGFASWSNPSENYGPITAGVVETFQEHYGLRVNGIANKITLNKIEEVLNPPYKSGDQGEPITELKEKLVKLGYASWENPSHNYGSITAGIVREFQRAYGLAADGVADDSILTKIDKLLAEGKYQIDDQGDHVVVLKKDLVRLGFASWLNPSENYGPITAGVVETFQEHYGLRVNGIANKITLNKIEEVLNPPYKSGDQGEPITELKEKLVKLGYASWENPSHNYGSITAGIVREFQRAYGLAADGVVDDGILTKIDKLLAEGKYQIDDQGDHVVALKKDLVRLGFASWSNPSENYGPITAGVVETFQEYYGLRVSGIANKITLNKIEEILSSKYSEGHSGDYVIELKENLTLLGFGNFPSNPSKNYGPITAGVVRNFQENYNLRVNGIADEVTLKTIKNNIVKVFIDPGHGGHDPGATGYGLQEKNIALDIAQNALVVLTKKYLGVDVKLSRSTDKFIELEERARMANTWNADYFVSVHINAAGGTGFESYIHNGRVSQATKTKQNQMHQYIIDQLKVYDRGMKSANFSVLRNTQMPAILLEYLFIDNKAENRKLSDISYRKFLGEVTADAIAKALNLKRR